MKITGKVTDDKMESLPSANIYISTAGGKPINVPNIGNIGTTSMADGSYEIVIPDGMTTGHISASYVGFDTATFQFDSNTKKASFKLLPSANTLQTFTIVESRSDAGIGKKIQNKKWIIPFIALVSLITVLIGVYLYNRRKNK